MQNNTSLFYCYSNRLHMFLEIFNCPYKFNAINPKNQKPYWAYERTEGLNKVLKEWEYLKTKLKQCNN